MNIQSLFTKAVVVGATAFYATLAALATFFVTMSVYFLVVDAVWPNPITPPDIVTFFVVVWALVSFLMARVAFALVVRRRLG